MGVSLGASQVCWKSHITSHDQVPGRARSHRRDVRGYRLSFFDDARRNVTGQGSAALKLI